MDFINKLVTIDSQKYGKVKAWLYQGNCKHGNSYFVLTKKNSMVLSGVVDEEGNEIIPIDNMDLTGLVVADNGSDLCYEFMHHDSNQPETYHVKIYDNKKAKLVFKTDYKSEIPLSICMMEDTQDYWLIEMGTEHKKYAIYDYKNVKMISTFFDEINYLTDSPYHSFYYSLNIESDIETYDGSKQLQTYSSLCGFLDEKGNLSSQIYDAEANKYYSSYLYGPDTLSPKFNELVKKVTKDHEEAYYVKDDEINEVLCYMYENCDMSEKPKNYKEKNKVLEYKPRKKV